MSRATRLLFLLSIVFAMTACAGSNGATEPSSRAPETNVMADTGARDGGGGGSNEAVATPGTSKKAGLPAKQVRDFVMAHLGRIRACFEVEARRTPSLRGVVTVRWQVEMGGTVSSASIARSTLGNPDVEDCIVSEVRGWAFPASDAPTVIAGFPFKFGTE